MKSMTDEKEEDNWYCCDDDWSIWLRFEAWIWAVLLLVQISMIAFLLVQGRKDKSFRQAFYVFFVAVTLVDCALALLRPSREWEETIFGTVYDIPFVDQQYPLLPSPTIRATLNQIIRHAVVPALDHAQPLFLTAIAVNRFTAFAFPLKHASMWRTRTVVVVAIILAATSVLLGAACTVVLAIHQAVKCPQATKEQPCASGGPGPVRRVAKEQRWELNCNYGTWAYEQILIPTALITLTSAICCTMSALLNVGSIGMLIALRTTAHSLWMFLLQLLLAFQDVVFVADNPEMIATDLAIWSLGRGPTWNDFRHSSEWLAGINGTRKWVDGMLCFTPGCMIAEVWYLLLIGELRLREEPDFTVRTLELRLFALSGSVFLLIVSGNVRNAYIEFYFKWPCLKRKRAQHSSVSVIAGTVSRARTRSVPTTSTMPTSSRPQATFVLTKQS